MRTTIKIAELLNTVNVNMIFERGRVMYVDAKFVGHDDYKDRGMVDDYAGHVHEGDNSVWASAYERSRHNNVLLKRVTDYCQRANLYLAVDALTAIVYTSGRDVISFEQSLTAIDEDGRKAIVKAQVWQGEDGANSYISVSVKIKNDNDVIVELNSTNAIKWDGDAMTHGSALVSHNSCALRCHDLSGN